MLSVWRAWAAKKPLIALTLLALLPRLVAAIFSGGYFAHDDHFLIIESAASWVQAPRYSTWLPWNQGDDPTPSGHSFFYVGLHYLLFSALKVIGLTDPKAQMIVIRLLHAVWSVVVVRTGYRIALHLSDREIAWRTGLFLALFYFMPFLAVRNLVEVACIPFLMLGSWQLLRHGPRPSYRDVLIAGIWIGLAVNVRFQTLFFAAGPGLALLLHRRVAPAVVYGLGVALPLVVFQGSIDLFLWGRPFAELTEYVVYNLNNTTTYFDQPWYNYLLLLLGIFIPFFSVAVFFGFFRKATPLLLWLPVLLFLAVHSYFPNKQERFLLPIVPLFFVLGYVAWEQWRAVSTWWHHRQGLWRSTMRFTWALNIGLLVVLCFSYSKRSRVEAMYGLREERPLRGILVEDSVEGEAPMPPLFYLGQWDMPVIPWKGTPGDLQGLVAERGNDVLPDIVLFIGEEDLKARMDKVEQALGPLTILRLAKPGLLDRVVHWLNPVNRNETVLIARVGVER